RHGQVAAGGGGAPVGLLHQADHRELPGDSPVRSDRGAGSGGHGVKINLTVESSSQYYGQATFGNSDWLDATMSLVDYGHRSVPNVFLTAPLETTNAKAGTGPGE